MIRKFSKIISLIVGMFLFFGLENMINLVHAANPLVRVAIIGDSKDSKECLLNSLSEVAKIHFGSVNRDENFLKVDNVSDLHCRVPNAYDMEITIIPGETFKEQLNESSVDGHRLSNDEYHCVLIAFDPSMYGDAVSTDTIIEDLNTNVVKPIKAFAPRLQICFVPFKDKLGESLKDFCDRLVQFTVQCDNISRAPYGYQDFAAAPILVNDGNMICDVFTIICSFECDRLLNSKPKQPNSDSRGQSARASKHSSKGSTSDSKKPKIKVKNEKYYKASNDIREYLINCGLYNSADIEGLIKTFKKMASDDGIVKEKGASSSCIFM